MLAFWLDKIKEVNHKWGEEINSHKLSALKNSTGARGWWETSKVIG